MTSTSNPFANAPVSGRRDHIGKFITPEQARAFLAAARDDRYGLALRLCLALGLRRGEACGLRDTDLDLDRSILSVRGTLTYAVGSGIAYGDAKTEAGTRTIELPASLVHAIRAHVEQREFERAAMGDVWQDSGYLFVGPTRGQAINPNVLSQACKRVLKAAGLDSTIRLHDMRHSYASFLHAEGVPMRDISAALGHANTSITQNLYVHVFGSAVSRAAAAVDALLTDDLTLELPAKKTEA